MTIKKVLTSVWEEIVYGGHILSIGAISIVYASSLILGIPVGWNFLIIVYLLVHIVYLYDRYKARDADTIVKQRSSSNFQRNYINYTPLIVSASIAVITFIQLFPKIKPGSLFLSFIMLFLGLSYSVCLKKITNKIPAFKNLFVPLVWSLLIALMILFYSFHFSLNIFLFFSFVYLRIFIGVASSDIKDIANDKKNGIKTLVLVLGKKKFLAILNFLNILPVFIIVGGVVAKIFPVFALSLILPSLYSYLYLQTAKDRKIDIFALTCNMIYAENLWWAPLVFLAKKII